MLPPRGVALPLAARSRGCPQLHRATTDGARTTATCRAAVTLVEALLLATTSALPLKDRRHRIRSQLLQHARKQRLLHWRSRGGSPGHHRPRRRARDDQDHRTAERRQEGVCATSAPMPDQLSSGRLPGFLPCSALSRTSVGTLACVSVRQAGPRVSSPRGGHERVGGSRGPRHLSSWAMLLGRARHAWGRTANS